jgi:nucleotide sugar dehydrogenase
MPKIGVIGYGVVGSAFTKYLETTLKNISHFSLVQGTRPQIKVYDKLKEKVPEKYRVEGLEHLFGFDYVFICLPTPLCIESGQLDTVSVKETCMHLFGKVPTIVIKSTLNPGDTRDIFDKCCSFSARTETSIAYLSQIFVNPEFVSAKTAYDDFMQSKLVLFGTESNDGSREKCTSLFQHLFPYKSLQFVSYEEAELTKISANTFYALKVHFFNVVHNMCTSFNADYETVRECMVKSRNWISASHTDVPGPDGRYGFGGACLPKDSFACANISSSEMLRLLAGENRSQRK